MVKASLDTKYLIIHEWEVAQNFLYMGLFAANVGKDDVYSCNIS